MATFATMLDVLKGLASRRCPKRNRGVQPHHRHAPRQRLQGLELLEERTLLSIGGGWDERALVSCAAVVDPAWFSEMAPHLTAGISSDSLTIRRETADGKGSAATVATDQWLVRLTPQTTRELASVAMAAGRLQAKLPDLQVVRGLGLPGMMLVEARAGSDLDLVESQLAASSDIAYYESNAVVSVDTLPNDTSFAQLWGMNNTGRRAARSMPTLTRPRHGTLRRAARALSLR